MFMRTKRQEYLTVSTLWGHLAHPREFFFKTKPIRAQIFSFLLLKLRVVNCQWKVLTRILRQTSVCVHVHVCFLLFAFFFFSFLIYEHKQFSSHKSVTWSQQCLRASVIVMGTLTGTVEIFRRADR